jgi:hypothetical protein
MDIVPKPLFDVALGESAFGYPGSARSFGKSLLRTGRESQGVVISHNPSLYHGVPHCDTAAWGEQGRSVSPSTSFQRMFNVLDELRREAEATFDLVTGDLKIDGIEEMRVAVTGSTAMLGKIASIRRKLDLYPEYRAALTMPKLKAFVDAHPECGVEMTGEGGQERFIFRKDIQHRFKILKLLDDDYLRSELTSLEYEANSKSAPIG